MSGFDLSGDFRLETMTTPNLNDWELLRSYALGLCEVPWSDRDFDTMRVWVSAQRHVPKMMNWHKYEFKVQPEEYVVRLDAGDRIGGIVKDDLNQPVFGAKLQ